MDTLTGFVRELSALLLLAAAAELLIPSGKLSGVVRLALGLAMIGTMLELLPGFSLMESEAFAWNFAQEEDYAEQGAALAERLSEEALVSYEEEVAAAVNTLALSVSGITGANATVKADAAGCVLALDLELEGNASAAATAAELIKEEMNLTEKQFTWRCGEEVRNGEGD